MPIPLTKQEKYDYILEAEKGQEDATVFHCRPLGSVDIMAVMSMSNEGKDEFTMCKESFRRGVEGWDNFGDERWRQGRDGFTRPDLLSLFTVKDIMEVGGDILSKSQASIKELGK